MIEHGHKLAAAAMDAQNEECNAPTCDALRCFAMSCSIAEHSKGGEARQRNSHTTADVHGNADATQCNSAQQATAPLVGEQPRKRLFDDASVRDIHFQAQMKGTRCNPYVFPIFLYHFPLKKALKKRTGTLKRIGTL